MTNETEGFALRESEDDVEGHGLSQPREAGLPRDAGIPREGIAQPRATEDDDVEGHGFGRPSPRNTGE
jgi:hypothetical protein